MIADRRPDAFIDLSLLDPALQPIHALAAAWRRPGGLAHAVADATVALPAGSALDVGLPDGWRALQVRDVTALATAALGRAAFTGRSLLFLLDVLAPLAAELDRLHAVLESDPHFGAALPRVVTASGQVRRIGPWPSAGLSLLPDGLLSVVPVEYILPEFVAPAFLVRREVVASVGGLEPGFESVAGALWHYLARARRLGFRCVVANEVTVAEIECEAARHDAPMCLELPRSDSDRLQQSIADTGRAFDELRRAPCHRHEMLLGRTLCAARSGEAALLLDARGMPPKFGGTTEATLGLADGLREVIAGSGITLLASQAAIEFHGLRRRYPAWRVEDAAGDSRFAVALHLAQPWYLQTAIELHELALFNLYVMHDTIAWDALYCAPEHLDATWRFVSGHSDALIFDSAYARDRFHRRFPAAREVPAFVSYFSFHPADYESGPVDPAANDYVLVVGNELHHKFLAPTVDQLANAFPFAAIKVLGTTETRWPNVEALGSGRLDETAVARLYAGARVVVFPSFYEGFGFPLVRGVVQGGVVVARRSHLLRELASQLRGPGKLLAYDTEPELVESVGRVLHGCELVLEPLANGLSDDGEPLRWVDIARNLLAFIERVAGDPGRSRWLERANHVAQLEAHRS
jgi:glycosyltransferase involved in cell wall biosynthesis